MERVHFLAGAAAAAAGPFVAVSQSDKPHVHGPNGIVTLPEHRPLEWTMEVLDGPKFTLSDYRGKVVFVNVFATWCPPCRQEQPDVVRFALAHPDDTAVFGMDYREDDDDVRRYRKKFKIPYPLAMDRSGAVLRGVYTKKGLVFPTTIVVRPDGTLSCVWTGDRERAWFEREREYALASLASPTPQPTS